jgi:hypothetical protein
MCRGLAIRLNYCKPPSAAKNIKIGEKRRRDRPLEAKKALVIEYKFVTYNCTIVH